MSENTITDIESTSLKVVAWAASLCWIARMVRIATSLPVSFCSSFHQNTTTLVRSRACSSRRHYARSILSFLFLCSLAPMFWTSLSMAFRVETPLLVSLSGGKPPRRGDVMLLTAYSQSRKPKVGDLVGFHVRNDILTVHRILAVSGNDLLTKGDDNGANDRGLYPTGKLYLDPNDVVGRVFGMAPAIGYLVIPFHENPLLFYVTFALEALAWLFLPRADKSRASLWSIVMLMLFWTCPGLSVG